MVAEMLEMKKEEPKRGVIQKEQYIPTVNTEGSSDLITVKVSY